jgi:protein ImuA
MIIPQGMGSNAAQTRWDVRPKFSEQTDTLMQWSLLKNKSGTVASWDILWNDETHHISVVPQAA